MDLPKTFKGKLAPRLRKIVVYRVLEQAEQEKRDTILPKDLLLSILDDDKTFGAHVIKAFNIDMQQFVIDIRKDNPIFQKPQNSKKYHESFFQLMRVAERVMHEMQVMQMGTEHVILAFLRYSGKSKHILNYKEIFEKHGIEYEKFYEGVISIANHVETKEEESTDESEKINKPKVIKKKTERKSPTKNSSNSGDTKNIFDQNLLKDLNKIVYAKNEKIVGREDQILQCIRILCRKKKSNPIIIGEPGVGKAQPLYSLVLTTNGWKTMGSLTLKDKIITPDGKIANISGIFPQEEKEIYELVFSDGRRSRSSIDHLWKIWKTSSHRNEEKRKANFYVKELKEIIKEKESNKNRRIYVPLIGSLNTKKIDLPIDPYVLGCLIGDGSLREDGLRFSSKDKFIINKINKKLKFGYTLKKVKKSKYDYYLNGNEKKGSRYSGLTNFYKAKLQDFYLLNKKSEEKFIPNIYMNASEDQKIDLIKGLMDTDGTVTKTGSISFCTTSFKLANDLQQLIWSIGGICKIKEKRTFYRYNKQKKEGRLSYVLSIRYKNPKNLFSLSRKKERISKDYQYKDLKLEIKEINLIKKENCQCIKVDSEDGLYITDTYIVTHNTTLVEGIVQSIIEQGVPQKLSNSTIYEISLGHMVAGTKYRGQFEEKMMNVIEFFSKNNDNSLQKIAFIDEIHHLIKAGSAEGAVDASFILKPKLADGTLRCIGTTTYDEYRKFILSDSALARRFRPVFLEEPSIEQTTEILNQVKDEYEEYHGIKISENLISRCVELASTYVKDRFFPDKAFDILDESCAQAVLDSRTEESDMIELQESVVEQVISNMTGIPLTTVCGSEKEKLSYLQSNIEREVIGQELAVTSICNSIKRSRLGFKDKDKPMGCYLFVGRTGVGKTLLAKKISEYLFGPDKIIRLDMSEYMEKHSVSRLIGAPPGYVGYDSGGQLTEKIRQKPYSVLLFDEIEKAHPEVVNILLQILDEGRLTDSFGRVADFRNTIIIMTSNLAASKLDKINSSMGFNVETKTQTAKETEKFLKEQAEKHFPPEFINRLDDIIVFGKFEKKDVDSIFELELKKSLGRLAENNYVVELSDSMKEQIKSEGYSEKYGARPMSRAIGRLLEVPLANAYFSGLINGDEVIVVDYKDGEVQFSNKKG